MDDTQRYVYWFGRRIEAFASENGIALKDSAGHVVKSLALSALPQVEWTGPGRTRTRLEIAHAVDAAVGHLVPDDFDAIQELLDSRGRKNTSQWNDDQSRAVEALNIALDRGTTPRHNSKGSQVPQLRGYTLGQGMDYEWWAEIYTDVELDRDRWTRAGYSKAQTGSWSGPAVGARTPRHPVSAGHRRRTAALPTSAETCVERAAAGEELDHVGGGVRAIGERAAQVAVTRSQRGEQQAGTYTVPDARKVYREDRVILVPSGPISLRRAQ